MPGLDFDFGASPNLITIGGRQLVGEGQKSGTYWALDRSTMQSVWHTEVGPGTPVGGILGSTAYDATGQLLFGPISGPVTSGHCTPTPAFLRGSPPVSAIRLHVSPVAVSNGVVYSLVTTGFVVAFHEQAGTLLTQMPLNPLGGSSLSEGGVAVADGLVIANTGSQQSNGAVVAFG
jgi:outer membrane protein assembly factor BamB